ncbi:hypothetical protein BSM4216_3384 [Bacillus smithii]|nr:hypothetical protein BSM4216_3384 [Bacillus smithii]
MKIRAKKRIELKGMRVELKVSLMLKGLIIMNWLHKRHQQLVE